MLRYYYAATYAAQPVLLGFQLSLYNKNTHTGHSMHSLVQVRCLQQVYFNRKNPFLVETSGKNSRSRSSQCLAALFSPMRFSVGAKEQPVWQ